MPARLYLSSQFIAPFPAYKKHKTLGHEARLISIESDHKLIRGTYCSGVVKQYCIVRNGSELGKTDGKIVYTENKCSRQ
jgi:hypothetical protein